MKSGCTESQSSRTLLSTKVVFRHRPWPGVRMVDLAGNDKFEGTYSVALPDHALAVQ